MAGMFKAYGAWGVRRAPAGVGWQLVARHGSPRAHGTSPPPSIEKEAHVANCPTGGMWPASRPRHATPVGRRHTVTPARSRGRRPALGGSPSAFVASALERARLAPSPPRQNHIPSAEHGREIAVACWRRRRSERSHAMATGCRRLPGRSGCSRRPGGVRISPAPSDSIAWCCRSE